MGKMKNGVLGQPSQSAGDLTFAPWKGLTIFKPKITENSSKSAKQIFQRARFGFVQSVTRLLSDPKIDPNFTKRFWSRWATKTTTMVNAFNSENIPLQAEYDPITPIPFAGEFSLIKFAKGTLEFLSAFVCNGYDALTGNINFGWANDITGNGELTDKVYIGVYYAGTGMLYISEAKTRADIEEDIVLPVGLTPGTGMPYFVFTFRGETGSEVTSNSVSDDVEAA